jgi:hypothetical protein
LYWDVEHASGVYLNDEGVVGHDVRDICPPSTTTYELYVKAPAGDVVRNVTVNVTLPTPLPFAPSDGSVLSCRSSETLIWNPIVAPSSVSSDVRLELQETFDNWQLVNEWAAVSGKQLDVNVQCGGYYRWRVHIWDGAGNSSDWSAWSYFTIGPDNTPPPIPSPVSPANGAELSCRASQTLVWEAVSDLSGISGYYGQLEFEVTEGSWQLDEWWGPVSGDRVDVSVGCGFYYRWRVRARDGASNYSDWSAWSGFGVLMD